MNVLRTDVPRRRVLVIEDDPIIQRVLEKVLSREGYAVTTTDSAIGAMDLARRLRPVVILLDLALPFRPGTGLLAELTADPDAAAVPVVVASARAEVLTAERRAAAAAVLAKPFSPRVLLETVRAVQATGAAATDAP
jgi:two-component system, repressor protein LuxO